MHINLLGPIEVSCADKPVRLSGQHQRALVAALASEIGKVVSAERLIETIWAGHPPRHAKVKLQGSVSGLRKALALAVPVSNGARLTLVTREPGYLINPDGVTVDLLEYRALLNLATGELDTGQVLAAARHLGEALGLWRGPRSEERRV